jgi:hypothetical protein
MMGDGLAQGVSDGQGRYIGGHKSISSEVVIG